MLKTLAILLGTALAGASISAGLACGESEPEPLVGALGLSCDRLHWKVGFTPSATVRFSADLERRVRGRWKLLRRLGPLRATAGPETVDVGPHPPGHYRASFRFTSGHTEIRRTILFRAGCTNPPPPMPTPTLPGGTSTLPFQ